MQLYVGNFLEGKIGKNNTPMDFRCGFCLETQYYPNATNTPSFYNCVFDKDEVVNHEKNTVSPHRTSFMGHHDAPII